MAIGTPPRRGLHVSDTPNAMQSCYTNARMPLTDFLVSSLLPWFVHNGRHHLPWRQAPTPYQVWVSEIMLQQTQVNRVIPYYERFLERFPTVQSLANTSWEEFLPYYAGLGYYRRGQNMLKTAQIIHEQYADIFPDTFSELKALPGIGEYTAHAILCFGFNQPVLTFDTNEQRVLGRYLHGSKTAKVDKQAVQTAIPQSISWSNLNAAMMDFANLVCTNKVPKCTECPLQTKCHYFQTKGIKEESTTTITERFPYRSAQAIIFLHENHQKYFSPRPDKYQPFTLPVGIVTRNQIKAYFRQRYQLELSVRPPFAKTFREDQPMLLVNAQILLGTHQFSEHERADMLDELNRYQADL
jgi:A/G-specific adenine glycosylase